ncbi:hypothetical protein NHX12_030285 [Muraenolepis orangiensis]|uniref:Uncharacterized protein n=1 Tax=Muraenolepis orangiensis TaxID=630683 RepID=A0A9Q0IJ97_9TELE|nr:hypothetical protein NHX12_030285 [Muraenolepis orangiensis]
MPSSFACPQDGFRSFPLKSVETLKRLMDTDGPANPHLAWTSVAVVCRDPNLPQVFQPVCEEKEVALTFSRIGGSAVRWNFKSRAVHAIHEGRGSLCIAFDKIMTEPGWDKETIAQSASLKQKLEDFDFTFLLGVFQFIFGLTEPLFQVLQSKTVDIKKCQDRIMSTLSALKATRTDETFSRIYDETVKAVGEPVPRRKGGGRGWEDLEQGFNQHQEGDQETLVSFRRLYFQIVDGVVLHMTQRFADMEHLNFFRILEHTSFASFCKPAAFPSIMYLYALGAVILYLLYHWVREMPRVSDKGAKHVYVTGCDSGFGEMLAHHLDALDLQHL